MISQKQVDYAVEIDTCLSLIVTLIADIKANKTLGQDLADLVGPFIQAVAGIGEISPETKNRKAIEQTVALKVSELVEVFLA